MRSFNFHQSAWTKHKRRPERRGQALATSCKRCPVHGGPDRGLRPGLQLGDVLDEVTARGIRIVPLAAVLADPVFSLKDEYVGPKGLSRLYRTSPGAFARWGAWDEAEATRIRTSFLESRTVAWRRPPGSLNPTGP